jgi:hypothetical protein
MQSFGIMLGFSIRGLLVLRWDSLELHESRLKAVQRTLSNFLLGWITAVLHNNVM